MTVRLGKEQSIRAIVISSVRPEPTSAGQILLHRHLVNQPGLEWESFGSEPPRLTASVAVRRMAGRLAQTRWRRFAHDFWAWRDGRWLDPWLPKAPPAGEQVVVVTVAQGDAFGAALRFAKKHRLPLVTFFHDWGPDMPPVHSLCRDMLDRQFRDLYHKSTVPLCISEGMLQALGSNAGAQVLLPIPEKRTADSPAPRSPQRPFRLLYLGNLFEYGPMLGGALETLADNPNVRLEVRGRNPQWPDELKKQTAASGTWLEFAPRTELDGWLETGDAFLVAMTFEPAMRRRMETCFPSKMPEMAQFEKPLVVWGPDYCSAVRWAQMGNRALCVTDPSPAALRQALEKLAAARGEQQRLADAARKAAQTDFNPDKIQAQFMQGLHSAVSRHLRNPQAG